MAIPRPNLFGNNRVAKVKNRGFSEKPVRNPKTGKMEPHLGADYGAPMGTPLKSWAAGKVVDVGHGPINGNFIKIDHGGGYTTTSIHLKEKPNFKKGDSIENGQLIGKVGSTGRSTGPHLHLKLALNGRAIDPESIYDLEEHIRPKSQQRQQVTTEQLILAPTPPPNKNVQVVNQNTATQNNTTMAGPRPNRQSRITGLDTGGISASDLLFQRFGKDITEVDEGDIEQLGKEVGFSRRDTRRAIKGLRKFQELENADIKLNRYGSRFNTVFSEREGEGTPAVKSGKRTGMRDKLSPASLLGLGRNVNYLAGMVGGLINKEPSQTSTSTFEPNIKQEPTLVIPELPTSKTDRTYEEPEPVITTPKQKVIDPASDEYVDKVLNGKYPGQDVKQGVPDLLTYVRRRLSEDKNSWDERGILSKIFAGVPFVDEKPTAANFIPEEDQIGGVGISPRDIDAIVLSDIKRTKEKAPSQTKFSQTIYGKGKGPSTYTIAPDNPEEYEAYYQSMLKRIAPEGDPGAGMGLFSPSSSVPAIGNLLNRIPGVGRLIKSAGMGRGAPVNRRYVDYVTNLSRPKSALPPRAPVVTPRQPLHGPFRQQGSPSAPVAPAPKQPLGLPEPKISRMARERGVTYNPSSGNTIITPTSAPISAKELLRLPAKGKPQSASLGTIGGEMGVTRAIPKDSKYFTQIQNALKKSPNSKKLELPDGTRVRLKKGGWETYKEGGSLPKYQSEEWGTNRLPGKILGKSWFTESGQEDLYGSNNFDGQTSYTTAPAGTGTTAPASSNDYRDYLSSQKLTGLGAKIASTPYKFDFSHLAPKSKEATGNDSGNGLGLWGGIKKLFGSKALGGGPDKSGMLGSALETLAVTAGPALLAGRNKIKGVNVPKFKEIEGRAGVPQDLPRDYQPLFNRPETGSSDFRENMFAQQGVDKYNKDAEMKYNLTNAMQKLKSKQDFGDLNRIAMFNAQMGQQGQLTQAELDARNQFYNQRNMADAMQAGFGNLADRWKYSQYANQAGQNQAFSNIITNPNTPEAVRQATAKKLGIEYNKKGGKLTAKNLLKRKK